MNAKNQNKISALCQMCYDANERQYGASEGEIEAHVENSDESEFKVVRYLTTISEYDLIGNCADCADGNKVEPALLNYLQSLEKQ